MNPVLQKTLCFKRLISGAVNRTANYRFDVSGKGVNVTRVLSQLGKKVMHITQLGGELRPLFLDLCKQDHLDIHWVESGSAIRFCYTIITEDPAEGHIVTELVEEGPPVASGTESCFLEAYTELLDAAKSVIISGTKARGFSDELVPAMVCRAREQNKKIILDIRGTDLKQSLVYKPDVIKPNLFEFIDTFMDDYKNMGELTGDEPGIKENVTALALELAAKHGTTVILTRGKHPVWYTSGGVLAEVPIEGAVPVNTTGSGDAFTAGLAAALDEDFPVREAIAKGIHCGSLNAGFLKPGVIKAP